MPRIPKSLNADPKNEPLALPRKRRGNRWYDSLPGMADAVDFIRDTHPSVRDLLADHIELEFSHIKDDMRQQRHYLSTGFARLRHMYFSQTRQRWHDKDPKIRRMFFCLAVMPKPFLIEFTLRVLIIAKIVIQLDLEGRYIDFDELHTCLKQPYRYRQHGR